MENAVASLIIFLCFSFFMFQAGYQWRKLEQDGKVQTGSGGTPGTGREQIWDGMVGKI